MGVFGRCRHKYDVEARSNGVQFEGDDAYILCTCICVHCLASQQRWVNVKEFGYDKKIVESMVESGDLVEIFYN